MNTQIGIIGLGKMGLPLAALLLEQGFVVTGYRRHSLEAFVDLGGRPARSCQEVAAQSEVVLTCLPHEATLHEVVAGPDGLVAGAHPGLVVIEISMVSLKAKERTRDALQAVGVPLLDCPISGTPPLVPARKTVFFGSGDADVFTACTPVLQAITNNIFYLGPFGAGSKMKCVANLLVAVHYAAAAEALVLSTRAGLDYEKVIEVIAPSIAGSAAFATRARTMVEKQYTPPLGSVNQVNEFIGLIDELADDLAAPTPLLTTAAEVFGRAAALGRGDQDLAAIYAVLDETTRTRSTARYQRGESPREHTE